MKTNEKAAEVVNNPQAGRGSLLIRDSREFGECVGEFPRGVEEVEGVRKWLKIIRNSQYT